MKCIVCHGQEIEIREVREAIQVGEDVVHVPIETRVCRSCGERYYERETLRYLEEVEEEVKAGNGRVREVGRVLRYG